MTFQIPDSDLTKFSVASLENLADIAATELTELRASIDRDNITEDQVTRLEALSGFTTAAQAEITRREVLASRFDAAVPAEVVASQPTEPVDESGAKDVSSTTPAPEVANTPSEVVAASVAPADSVAAANAVAVRTVTLADVAPHAPLPAESTTEGVNYTIIASSNIATSAHTINSGQAMTWRDLGSAFVEQTRTHQGMRKGAIKGRHSKDLAMIRRDFSDAQTLLPGDTEESAYTKLAATARAHELQEVTAANGWCAPSEPDYSICSPISMDGLLNLPEQVLRRGGKLHNQGLDFGDFFGNDFVLPIPGFNILTEAEVIADTAKTCVEIPCPPFVDDRLNVAALCLTSSLLQNRGYPEFVSTFVEGAIAAMAHLVNREVINEIVTGSTAVSLLTVDPWVTDGTVYSQVLSAVEFAVKDMRYVYRTRRDQVFDVVLPYWLLAAMRADYVRRNAAANDDLADEAINAAFARRGARVQWVYDWQDAFNPGAIPATNQLGNATPPFNYPTTLSFLIFLPGTWILGRQDVVRLESVYDSTNLAQNLVTQLFMEDGFRPMRMCQHSRVYSVPICANGSTGVQRAVTCTDVTP